MSSHEINFDAIVGPTHNYSGLSQGNLASTSHEKSISHPKKAALQGLRKMKFLHDLGVIQAVLPPHERPYLPILRTLGFKGNNRKVIEKCSQTDLELLHRCSSASAMWAANSAWITPSCDSADKKVQITPANLHYFFHRSIETEVTHRILKRIFSDEKYFKVHSPLPANNTFADEGSANHMLICPQYGSPGMHIFVHGRSAFHRENNLPKIYPARQTLEATQAIARRHSILENRAYHFRQNTQAIDAGVFHNDVIAVSNLDLILCHENAFADQINVLEKLARNFEMLCKTPLKIITVKEQDLSLSDAVNSYLFNSQLVRLPDGSQCLIAPSECQEMHNVNQLLQKLLNDPAQPIKHLHFVDLRESMANGGGPGCVRLRVVLNAAEQKALLQSVIFTDALYEKLTSWVEKHYRETLTPDDLADPALYIESCNALNELTQILNLGAIYDFEELH